MRKIVEILCIEVVPERYHRAFFLIFFALMMVAIKIVIDIGAK